MPEKTIQIEIAKGNLSPDDVVLYWVRADGRGLSLVEKVVFDMTGRPSSNWPLNVFSYDAELARELIGLQREKKS